MDKSDFTKKFRKIIQNAEVVSQSLVLVRCLLNAREMPVDAEGQNARDMILKTIALADSYAFDFGNLLKSFQEEFLRADESVQDV